MQNRARRKGGKGGKYEEIKHEMRRLLTEIKDEKERNERKR